MNLRPLANPDGYLTPKQVAERLERTERTLWKWRKARRGPKYKRLEGRVYYPIDEFNIWLNAGEWA
jgi:predicted DNA-binding transcriptional regulator AlpA